MFDQLKNKRLLLIATGGGSDIVSASFFAQYLSDTNTQIDVAGMLSPGAYHLFDGKEEAPVNILTENSSRAIGTKSPIPIRFIDSHLRSLCIAENMGIRRFYDLSSRFGTAALCDGIEKLIQQNAYDLVIGVDVGGDILARGSIDANILSPSMDLTTLHILGNLTTPTYLVEFGIGTDGELRTEAIGEILQEMRDKSLLLERSHINKGDTQVQVLRKVFGEIGKIRTGNTVPRTLRTFEETEDIYCTHERRLKIGEHTWNDSFEVRLRKEYFGEIYLLDAKRLWEERKEVAFSYKNLLEQYIHHKRIETWGHEMDSDYLWSGKEWTTPIIGDGNCLYLMAIPKYFLGEQRDQALKLSVEHMRSGHGDAMLVYSSDKEIFPPEIYTTVVDRFCVAGKRDAVDHTAASITK